MTFVFKGVWENVVITQSVKCLYKHKDLVPRTHLKSSTSVLVSDRQIFEVHWSALTKLLGEIQAHEKTCLRNQNGQ